MLFVGQCGVAGTPTWSPPTWMLLIIWEGESLESDNLLFVEAENKDIECMSSVGLVLRDCKSMLKDIPESNLIFVKATPIEWKL